MSVEMPGMEAGPAGKYLILRAAALPGAAPHSIPLSLQPGPRTLHACLGSD